MDSQNFAIVNDVLNICWNHGRKFEKSSNNLGRKIKDYLIHSHGVIIFFFRKMQHMISVSSEHIACVVYEKVYNEIATLYADLVNLPCN